MARLPDKRDVERPLAPAVIQRNVPDMTGVYGTGKGKLVAAQAWGQGLKDLGEGLFSLGSDIKRRRDTTDLLRAEAMFTNETNAAKLDITSNPNKYQTAVPTYTERRTKALSRSSAIFRDPSIRAKFEASKADTSDVAAIQEWATKREQEDQLAVGEQSARDHVKDLTNPSAKDGYYKVRDTMFDLGLLTEAGKIEWDNKILYPAEKEYITALTNVKPKEAVSILTGDQAIKASLGYDEARGQYNILERSGLGYAGKYQLGGQLLQDVGIYTPAPGMKWNSKARLGKAKWSGGVFNIPGFEPMGIDEFLNNGPAQEAAMDAVIEWNDKRFAELGLDKYIGTVVGGVPITREGLHAMWHLGQQATIETLKSANPQATAAAWADANGTTVLQYASNAARRNLSGSMSQADRSVALDKAQTEAVMAETIPIIKDLTASEDDVADAVSSAVDRGIDINAQGRLDRALYQRAKAQENAKEARWFSDPNSVADPNNQKHKDAVDNQWLKEDGSGRQLVINGDEEYWRGTALTAVQSKNIIPPVMKGTVEALVRSSDPNLLVRGLGYLVDLKAASPAAYERDIEARDKLDASRYTSELSVYSKEEIAAKIIEERASPSKAELHTALEKEGKDKAEELAPYVDAYFGDIWWPEIPFFANVKSYGPLKKPANDLENAELQQRFKNLFIPVYARTGSVDKTLGTIVPIIQSEYKTTTIGGITRIGKNTPEKFNPPELQGNDWQHKQARARIPEHLLSEGALFTLKADTRTELELAQGKEPTWVVLIPGTVTTAPQEPSKLRILSKVQKRAAN